MHKGGIISLQNHRKNNRHTQRTISEQNEENIKERSEQNEENIKEWIKIHFDGAATKQFTIYYLKYITLYY